MSGLPWDNGGFWMLLLIIGPFAVIIAMLLLGLVGTAIQVAVETIWQGYLVVRREHQKAPR